MGDISKGVANAIQPAKKKKKITKKKKAISTEGQVTYDFTSFPGIFRLLYFLDYRMSIR